MGTLATLVIKIVGDASGFEKTAGDAQSKAKALGKGMTALGKKATLGLTLPILAAGAATVKLASNFEENLSKVNVVFDENAKQVERWSKSTASSIGISQSKALEAAGTYGNLFRAMDVLPDAATDMSIGLVNLAADLASFNDLDPEEVLLKLQSGLVGMAMPLRSVGINLTAAGTELKAFEMGLEDANGDLSEAALLTARYAIIMEQSALAQGDFARTSEGLANTQRQLKAVMSDLGVEFGMVLLPIVTDIAKSLITLIDWFRELSPATKKTIVIIAGLVAVVGPLLIFFGAIIGAIGTLIPLFAAILSPIGLLIIGLIALGVAIFIFRDDIINGLTAAWNFIKEIVGNVIGKFTELWNTITSINWLELGKNVIGGIVSGIKNGLGSLASGVANVGSTIISGIGNFLGIGSDSKLAFEMLGLPTGGGIVGGTIAAIKEGFAGVDVGGALSAAIPTDGGSAVAGAKTSGSPTGGSNEGREVNIVIHNPIAEPASETIPRELKKLVFLGVLK